MAQDRSGLPLADFFWIAGVDSLSYDKDDSSDEEESTDHRQSFIAPPIKEEEDNVENGVPSEPHPSTSGPSKASARHSRQGSNPKILNHRPLSTATEGSTDSRRSSQATITALNPQKGYDQDFNRAMRKFANEREDFLAELSFSAGAQTSSKGTKLHKVQRIRNEDPSQIRRSGMGNLARRISFRDMGSAKRQSSVGRSASIRTTKRMSNYNSVIPSPEPLPAAQNMHPLKRKFEPVLLDRYPAKHMVDELSRRAPFPDYIPMFAFPNDVHIVSADERPRSTWHGFAMTSGDNSKLYGICVLIWIPLNQRLAQDVERRCERWRRKNTSSEEREMAESLAVRLAGERAKLSELLVRLPTITSGSSARQALEDDISATEEKIAMMTELLKPWRHGASAKIEGLTEGDSGLWIPRAYGILGRDNSMVGFWKEWLKAVLVPMFSGALLRIPPTSPKIGLWQPIERYVVNLCTEAPSPASSKTQVELAIRELRLYARREAINEVPGSRTTDLYSLFRCLRIENIVVLLEFALMESRIVFLSSYTSMLHLATRALVSLLWPFTWCGVYIPVLPARLISAIEAPCPYIVGIERRYDNLCLPDDDFVCVDLDRDSIDSTSNPVHFPRSQRKKLISLLQLSAPHHFRYGVDVGPSAHAIESYPFDAFSSENRSVFTPEAPPNMLNKFVQQNSTSFAEEYMDAGPRKPIFNAFLQAKGGRGSTSERTMTSSSRETKANSTAASSNSSFKGSTAPISRADSGLALTNALREKRSGHFDLASRRSSTLNMNHGSSGRRPSIPSGHASSPSISTLGHGINYAPSIYAPSTIAASTIMPNVDLNPVRNTAESYWIEGHCLAWCPNDVDSTCVICEERSEEGIHRCTACNLSIHSRCSNQLCLPCPIAFKPDQVRAAIVRCYASLLYGYRKHISHANSEQKKSGMMYRFNMESFVRSCPSEAQEFFASLRLTQMLAEFISDRERKPASDPQIMLFDQIILGKRNRGKASYFNALSSRSKTKQTSYLDDTSEHLWRTASVQPPIARFPGDYRQVISRIPAKLDPVLMKEPRMVQGAPVGGRQGPGGGTKARRKPIPSMLSTLSPMDLPDIEPEESQLSPTLSNHSERTGNSGASGASRNGRGVRV